ncbi:MAG: PfkB family carbohydrate kinase [Lachnospiraceae bacterium]|nr:PfkB family carbohydrate kinase [Lachnospiraceae bacterium]
MRKKILLMNDLPGYGRAALSTMMPLLSDKGYCIYNLPTALVSNTFDFGKYSVLDTTDYMRSSMETWKMLGFSFDAVCVGYIVSDRQSELIREYCLKWATEGVSVWLDPVMADNGRFYNGIGDGRVRLLRKMLPISDYIVPNYTEAALLAGRAYKREALTCKEAEELIDILKDMGAKSVIITSADVNGEKAIIGYDNLTHNYFTHKYIQIKGNISGTGDVFLAALVGEALKGEELAKSVKIASDAVKEWILKPI